MKNIKTHPKAGFTLVEIMIVVAIIGLLAAIAIPNYVRARESTQTNVCINNLRVIDEAKQQWALDHGKVSTDVPVAADLMPYLGRSGNVMPQCPIGPTDYGLAEDVSTTPTCPHASPDATGTHYAVLAF